MNAYYSFLCKYKYNNIKSEHVNCRISMGPVADVNFSSCEIQQRHFTVIHFIGVVE